MVHSFAPFEQVRLGMLGKPLSHLWRGHGTAIFLEIGELTPSTKMRRDGSRMNDLGDFGIMLDCRWRIENATAIICGSGDDHPTWDDILPSLIGLTVEDVHLTGRIAELSVSFSSDLHLTSFADSGSVIDGQPEWTIFDRTASEHWAYSWASGGVVREPASRPIQSGSA